MIYHVNAFCNLRPVYEHNAPLKLSGSQERNQDFAKRGCGPIVEKFCSKNVSFRWRAERTSATQVYHRRRYGGEARSSWAIFVIF